MGNLTKAKNNEKPMIQRFRAELRSTYCKFDKPEICQMKNYLYNGKTEIINKQ